METERLRAMCEGDGELRLMARWWTGSVTLDIGHDSFSIAFDDGVLTSFVSPADTTGDIGLSAPAELWDDILAPVPPPFCNDIMPAQALGLVVSADTVTFWQYYPVVRRLVELMRADRNANTSAVPARGE